MRRLPAILLLALLTGCSNAPVAGLLDAVSPAKSGPAKPTSPDPLVPEVGPSPGPRPPAQPDGDALPPPADVLPPVGPRGP